MPYFSIIIPTLNEEKYLPRLLQNVKNQTFQDNEVIIVDGHSEDKTKEKATAFQNDLDLTFLETKTRNVSHQRNLGASKAKGKVCIFFDADTQIPTDYLEAINRAFKQKKPHLLTTWIQAEDTGQEDKLIATGSNLLFESTKFIGNPACYGAMIAVKTKVFEDLGGFDEKAQFAEDSQFIQKAVDHNYKYTILKKPQYTFSLRRFKKEGTLETISHYLKLNLATLRNGYHGPHPEYPMGGHVFDPNDTVKDQQSLRWLKKVILSMRTQTKRQRKKLFAFLSDLIEEDGSLKDS